MLQQQYYDKLAAKLANASRKLPTSAVVQQPSVTTGKLCKPEAHGLSM